MLNASREIPGGEWKLTLDYVLAELVADGLVSEAQAQELGVGRPADPSVHPLVRVAAQEWQSAKAPHTPLTLERLTRWLSEKSNLPYLRIDPLRIDVGAVTSVVKQSYATRFKILPVAVKGERVTIATAEPYVREWERELSGMLKLRFDRVIANPLDLDRYLAEFYAVSRSIAGASSDSGASPISSVGNLEQLVELGRTGEPDANDQHVVRIVDWLLQYAFDQRASDIHLEPRRDTGNIRFRIDGVLHLVHQIPTPVLNAAVSRLKALGRMDIIEKRRPQDGRIKTLTPERKEVELRLSTMPTTFGEKLVMRIFDPEVLVRSLTDLGFSPNEEKQWQSMVTQSYCPDPRSTSALSRTPSSSWTRTSIRCTSSTRSVSISPPACAHCCARIPTSSWWGRSGTRRLPTPPSRRRSRGISCSRHCTRTTRRRP
jgi:general secretion pathway protein E